MSKVTLHRGDCLEIMKSIPDKSIDLVLTDPPYNIKKAEWDSIPDYVEWCGKWVKECERVLKDTGSFYFFHNDMEQISDIMVKIKEITGFVFKQFIVWNKRFDGARLKGYLDGHVCVGGLRNYKQMAEYCLFYTFQDETGLSRVMLDTDNFKPLREYFKDFQSALGMNKKEILDKIGQRADHCFRWGSAQWDMPTPETYAELCGLPLRYEFIRREYEDLRREYEDLRYVFNSKGTHHSVWNYSIAENAGHPTTKPVDMLVNIIEHSSHEGQTVLDPFMGSGSTGVACINTNRRFIGIEKDAEYFKIAEKRINEATGVVV